MVKKVECVQLECQYCGKPFQRIPSQANGAKYCSRSCAAKARTGDKNPNWKGGKVRRICETCGIEFRAKAKDVRKGYARFCSRACWGKWRSTVYTGAKGCNWQGGPVICTCDFCGATYEANNYRAQYTRFCSTSCHDEARKTGELHECEICGAEFYVAQSRAEQGQGRFCSLACKGIGLSGPASPAWKGGTSFEPYPATFNDRFKQRIRQRDGHQCQICGADAECVHHINYEKDNTEPDNCIALCRACHGRTNYNRDFWHGVLLTYQQSRNEVACV